jgi:hypothetical protein
MSWDDLLGERTLDAIRTDVRHPFDTDAAGVALDLGGLTVFIFEDPSDGYRSFGVSPDYIRVPVRVSRWTKGEREGEADGLEFTDRRNGKVVLRVGTDNTDDYYPSFVCDWRPQNLADNAAVETPQ